MKRLLGKTCLVGFIFSIFIYPVITSAVPCGPTINYPPQPFLHQAEVDDYYMPPYEFSPFGHYTYGPSYWGQHCGLVWTRQACTPVNTCRWRNMYPYCQRRWVCHSRPVYVKRCWTGY